MFLSWEMLILLNRRFNVPFRSACISRLVGVSSGDLRRKDSSTLEEGIDWNVSCPLKSSMFPRVFSGRFEYSRNRYWMKLFISILSHQFHWDFPRLFKLSLYSLLHTAVSKYLSISCILTVWQVAHFEYYAVAFEVTVVVILLGYHGVNPVFKNVISLWSSLSCYSKMTRSCAQTCAPGSLITAARPSAVFGPKPAHLSIFWWDRILKLET